MTMNVKAVIALTAVILLATIAPIVAGTMLVVIVVGHLVLTPTTKQEFRAPPSPFIHRKRVYLSSDAWDSKRKQRLAIDNYTCQGCGCKKPLEVHHITYINIFREEMRDLVSVCRGCHQNIHDVLGYDYSDTFPVNPSSLDKLNNLTL